MAKLVAARAWCNNEVAYLAWKTDGKIDGCLGFMITRIHLDLNGQEVERRNLPTWVAFATQSNPKWEEQDTSVWPIQKFSWRDLTLRKSRNTLTTRPPAFKAKYEIVPVGLPGPGRAPVPPSPTAQPGKYKGAPIPLFICGDSIQTDEILVTSEFGDISVTFTNGILSTQNLRKQLETPDGLAPTKQQIDAHIQKPGDPIRTFLAGDVLPALRSLFERADQVDGHVHLALYELDDPELENLLATHQKRLDLILCTAGSKSPPKGSGLPVTWDVTNQPVRAKLQKLMGSRLQNRMFNNSDHIGHNKFAVLLDKHGKPTTVWTGSTNWTPTGLCAQTNNTIILTSDTVAAAYLDYWKRLHADKLPTPKPLTAPLASNQGGPARGRCAFEEGPARRAPDAGGAVVFAEHARGGNAEDAHGAPRSRGGVRADEKGQGRDLLPRLQSGTERSRGRGRQHRGLRGDRVRPPRFEAHGDGGHQRPYRGAWLCGAAARSEEGQDEAQDPASRHLLAERSA
jgi:hypothetical protein